MLDRNISFYNIILRCDSYKYKYKEVILPNGFSIIVYKKVYEKEWAKLEFFVGDFNSLDEAERYFVTSYMQDKDLLKNIRFLLNEDKAVIGSCIAW